MTSQKSFKNNFGFAYRTGLKSNIAVALIQFFIGALAFVYVPAKALFKKVAADSASGKIESYNVKNDYSFYLTDNMQYLRYLLIAAFLILGIIMGIVTFKFMTGKKTMNVYYSLGIKRTHLFTAKYLSGLTLMAVAIFLPILADVIMNTVKLGMSSKLLFSALFYFLGLFSLSALSYSLTAMVFSAVGTVFEGAVFSGIIVSMPAIILYCVQSFIIRLVPGTPFGVVFSLSGYSGSEESIFNKLPWCTPFTYLSKGLYQNMYANAKGKIAGYETGKLVDWTTPDFRSILLWFGITVVLFFCAMIVYKKRKAEIGGFIGKNNVLNFLCTFTIGFYGFVLAYSFSSTYIGKWPSLAISCLIFAVIYFVLDIIFIRNLKLFAKGLYKLPIHLAAALLIFAFFATGYFGAASKTPKIEKISNIKITSGYTSYSDDAESDSSYYGLNNFSFSGCFYPSGEFESAADKQKILDIHNALAKCGLLTVADTYNSDIHPMYIKIVYTLNDGKQVKRAYYGVNQDIYNMLLDLDKSDYRTARLYDALFGKYKTEDQYSKDDIKAYKNAVEKRDLEYISQYNFNTYKRALQDDSSTITFYNKSAFGTELEISSEERKKLLAHIYNDISTLSPAKLYNPTETYGALAFAAAPNSFEAQDSNMSSEYYSGGLAYATGVAQVDTPSQSTPVIYITPDMKETVAYLKELGFLDAALNTKNNIKAVYVSKISDLYNSNNYTRYVSKLSMGKEALGQSVYPGGEYQYKSTDKNVIDKLYSVSVMRHIVSIQDDYLVTFEIVGEENEKTAYAMCISGSMLPEDIKQQTDGAVLNDNSNFGAIPNSDSNA